VALAAPVGDEHHIAALEIPVDDPLGMRGREPGAHLLDQRQRLGRRQPTRPGDALRQRLSFQELHDQELHCRSGGRP
jgi:hypothetical protein